MKAFELQTIIYQQGETIFAVSILNTSDKSETLVIGFGDIPGLLPIGYFIMGSVKLAECIKCAEN